jgi:hypothetical protein
MAKRMMAALGLCLAVAAGGVLLLASDVASKPGPSAPLEVLQFLEGSWVATGDGFSSRLTYDWALPGVLLRARNELRNGAGDLSGRYEGHYVWDPADGRIAFWTVSREGELHRGTVVLRDGRLWHDATVSGGAIAGYRSVLARVDDDLHYRAVYRPAATDADVLGAAPLIYRRREAQRPAGP